MELFLGDIIVSYKPSSNLKVLRHLFDDGISKYSKKIFGEGCLFPIANHVRWVVDCERVFHWTFPKSQYQCIEDWMADPDYAMVMRRYGGEYDPERIRRFCDSNEGTFYDLGELFDMWLGFPRFFDFGRNHHVCSTGVRAGMFHSGYSEPHWLRVSKTPPCMWANLPKLYWQVNAPRGRAAAAPRYCEVSKPIDSTMPRSIEGLARVAKGGYV